MRLPDDLFDAATLRHQLGATSNGAPCLTNEPFPGPPLRANAVITTPWRHRPVIGQPSDAVDLAYWYRRSAWAQRWRPKQLLVPFWLPAEHSVSYPDAQPLPDGTGIRLPFPLVFVAFAAPWHIEPRHDDIPEALAAHQMLMFYARGRAASTGTPDPLHAVLARLQSTGLTDRSSLPTPLEILDGYGGMVEGLLLTSDPDGRPSDDFAWCLAIYHPGGFPFARITVPASRAQSDWRQQVDSIIAGIALSCWHQPTGDSPHRATTVIGHHGDAQIASGVHVLNIDATSPNIRPRRTSAVTARSPRPHLRRGHWRRQPIGEGRRTTRWTWVRATAVNGTHVTTDQVYVLPDRTHPVAATRTD